MKKMIYLLAFCATLLFNVSVADAEPRTFTLKKGDKTVILFGTIHITKPDWLPLPQTISQQLTAADALAVELDMKDPKTVSETMQYMAALGTADTHLSTMLTPKELKKAKELLGPMADGVLQMKPWLVAVTAIYIRTQKLGFSDTAIEEILSRQARNEQKPVIALETVAQQFAVFEQLTAEEEKTFLQQSLLNDDETFKKEIELTVKVWKNNDKQAANQLLEKFKNTTPRLYQAMFEQRNRLMVKRIEQINQQHSALMVAVGALHLYGTNGVIDLLEGKGYSITD